MIKYVISLLASMIVGITVFAQESAPQPFNYCNVARDRQNKPITGKTVAIRLTILKTSPTGGIVYQEKQLTPTNYFGTFLIALGSGTAQIGSFDKIKWADDSYYIKVDLDASGGSDFSALTAPELLHVPFGQYARSGGIEPGKNVRTGFIHYVGEPYGGGIVFDTWKDAKGVEHGLVVAPNDQDDSISWSNKENAAAGLAAQSISNGAANTAAILSQSGHLRSAAQRCHSYSGGGFHDWYLPSVAELNLLDDNREKIKKALSKEGHPLGQFIYWTSTEISASNAFVFARYGLPSNNMVFSKYSPLHVRAIRSF